MFSSWSSLTRSQKFQIALCVLGVFVASTSQLEVLVGKEITTAVVAFSGLAIAMTSGIGAIVTGQGQQLQAVVDMAKDPKSAVQAIVTTANPEGKALAASMPGPIVSAGSNSAIEAVKP